MASLPRRASAGAIVPAGVLGVAADALARAPDTPVSGGGPPAWLGFLIVFVLIAIVVFISLLPSKRGHND